MSNPTLPGTQRVRFEEVTPAHTIAAFFAGNLQPLVTRLHLPVYDGYDDLDEIQFVFLTLPSGQTVTLGQYAGSPQIGVDLYLDLKLQEPVSVVFETCKYLEISRQEVVWFHPDWEAEIDKLYAEHSEMEKRPDLSQVDESAQGNQYEPIDCFNHALRIYTREDFPEYWAMLQHNLGLAYTDRTQGDQIENLERSIKCFKKSQEIYTLEDYPGKWRINQQDLHKSRNSLTENLFRDIITLPTQKRKAYGATNLGCANLSHANLSGANLSHANFSGTNLNHSNVSGSYIYTIVGTKLIRANLIHADVNNARLGFSSRILKSVKKDLIEPRTIIEYSSDDRSEFKNLVPC